MNRTPSRAPSLTKRAFLGAAALLVALPVFFLAWKNTRSYLRFTFALKRELAKHLDATQVHGFKMFLNPRDKVITPHIMSYGQWESLETSLVVKRLKRGDVFVDGGANVGYYTLLAAHLVGDKGRVYAFEPEPESFKILQKNVLLNGLKNVVLEQKALGSKKGKLKLYVNTVNRGDHRLHLFKGEKKAYVLVDVVRLDEYLRGKRVDLVKIDVQGAEGAVIEGMKNLFDVNPRMKIVMEFSPGSLRNFGTDPLRLYTFLQSKNYSFYDIDVKMDRITRTDLPALYRRYGKDGKWETNLFLDR